MDIAAWLESLGLERYAPAFRRNHIDRELLATLTADDLREIGVASLGHRKRLLAAITALAGSAATSPTDPAPRRAERRQLTIMFVDLVGSTALAGKLDPEEMSDVLQSYQNAVVGELACFEGHVARFMGDGVLIHWGWPRAHEDAAERAVRAGLAITAAVGRLTTPAGENLLARIGIATGLVVVGDLIGEGAAQEEVVVGETPNLAARLQALAEPGAVLIGPATRQLVGDLFACADLGACTLKGMRGSLCSRVR
jgi:class 3 adenylate cyclase